MTRIAYDVVQNDREDLEGKIIDYIYANGEVSKAMVVGCNGAIGITIVKADDKKYKLLCFRGPVVSDPTPFDMSKCTWDDMYNAIVDGIEKGAVYPGELLILRHGYVPPQGSCSTACAYNQ